MEISLSSHTHKLLTEYIEKGGYASADDAVRAALETLEQIEGAALEKLDAETQAAIKRARAQSGRGEGRSWGDVRAELRQRFSIE